MVSTGRFRSIASLAIAIAACGIMARQEPVMLAGITILLWLGFEWFWFRLRAILTGPPLLSVNRQIAELNERTSTLNLDRAYRVEVEVEAAPWTRGLRLWLLDIVPDHLLQMETSPRHVQDIGSGRVSWSYQLEPSVVGRTQLPGIQVIVTDPRGLFRRQYFVPATRELTILPFLARPQATHSVLKRNNIQVINGNHRYRRPGFSTELLGIRDYQPGDPPRSIAWKASARLGKMMTCEYENEVPIRSTILCDLSEYQFVGRPGPAVADRVISAAASLARLLLADRDPVGAELIAGNDHVRLNHGSGERHLTRFLQTMLRYCERRQVSSDMELESLIRLIWVAAYRRFPELFDDQINHVGPKLFPLSQPNHLMVTQREQLSFALATLYGDSIGYAERLQHDESEFRRRVRQYMADFPLRQAPIRRLLDASTQRETETAAMSRICLSLNRGVARAKDNELFLILSITPMHFNEINRLADSVRMASAAHHRVIYLDVGTQVPHGGFLDVRASHILAKSRVRGLAEQQQRLQQSLVKYGARISSINDPRLIETVAEEVELLRSGRTRHGASATTRR